MPVRSSLFTSPQGETAYMAFYDAAMKLWPLPCEERSLETRFGRVHAILSGEPDAPALLLLHAAHTSSTIWIPNVKALGARFRLIALDLLGHLGKSMPTRRLSHSADCAAWITEALDQLEVEQVRVLGLSAGAWFGLNLALHEPDRVEGVAACSPLGAFGPVSLGALLRLLPLAFRPSRRLSERYIRWLCAEGATLDETLREQFLVGMEHFKGRHPELFIPRPFTPGELERIVPPVLLLLGQEEVMYSPRQVVKRAVTYLRDVEVEVIPRAAHLLTIEQPDLVNRRLLSFLDWPLAARPLYA